MLDKCQFSMKVVEKDNGPNNRSEDTDQTLVSPPERDRSVEIVHQVTPHAITTTKQITNQGIFLLRSHIWNKRKYKQLVSRTAKNNFIYNYKVIY